MTEGTAEVLAANKLARKAWLKRDNLVRSFLYHSCDKGQQEALVTCKTAFSMWTSLTTRYMQSTEERQQSLQILYLNYKFKPEHDVKNHIEAIKLLAQHLEDARAPVTESNLIIRITTSLPPSFHNFLSGWESVPVVDRKIDSLTRRLIQEETRSKERNGGDRSKEDKAFFGIVDDPPNSRGFHAGNRFSPYPRGRGYVNRGNRGGFGNRSLRGNRGGQNNQTGQVQNNQSAIDKQYAIDFENGACYTCHVPGHLSRNCRNGKKETQPQGKTAEGKTAEGNTPPF